MARILVVDDVPQVRTALRRVLEMLGHEAREAENGGAAMGRLAADTFDLVITDINMPDMDGVELILAMVERWPRIPIIAMSGGGLVPKELLLDTASALGVVAAVPKPLDIERLRGAVEAALGKLDQQGEATGA